MGRVSRPPDSVLWNYVQTLVHQLRTTDALFLPQKVPCSRVTRLQVLGVGAYAGIGDTVLLALLVYLPLWFVLRGLDRLRPCSSLPKPDAAGWWLSVSRRELIPQGLPKAKPIQLTQDNSLLCYGDGGVRIELAHRRLGPLATLLELPVPTTLRGGAMNLQMQLLVQSAVDDVATRLNVRRVGSRWKQS